LLLDINNVFVSAKNHGTLPLIPSPHQNDFSM
jgi:uncharacterized protein (UPF0276 family)